MEGEGKREEGRGWRIEDGRLYKKGMEGDGAGTAKLDSGARWGARTSAHTSVWKKLAAVPTWTSSPMKRTGHGLSLRHGNMPLIPLGLWGI